MDGGESSTGVDPTFQFYAKEDEGAKGVAQYEATAQEQADVDIRGLSHDKFIAFMKSQPKETAFTFNGKIIPRFLLGDITKPLPEVITILSPKERYSMTNVYSPKNRVGKRGLKLGPPYYNYKKSNEKSCKTVKGTRA
jgi:hypothetical protein